MCYLKALGFYPVSCNFRYIAGSKFPKDFMDKLCDQIRSGVKMIMS